MTLCILGSTVWLGASRTVSAAIDGCLVGTWTATKLVDLSRQGSGGAGFRVTFEDDGTETVDYSAMERISFARGDGSYYTGTAQGRISTRDRKATLDGGVTSGVRVKISTLFPDIPPTPLRGMLGPGGLGTTNGDNAYRCTTETLEYQSSAAADRHPTHAVTLTRGEVAPAEEPEHGVREGGAGVGEGAGGEPGATAGGPDKAPSTLDPRLWQEFLQMLEEEDKSRPAPAGPPALPPRKEAWMNEEGLPTTSGCDKVCLHDAEEVRRSLLRGDALRESATDAAKRTEEAFQEWKKAHAAWENVFAANPSYPLVSQASGREYIAARDADVAARGAYDESLRAYNRCDEKLRAERARCVKAIARQNACLKEKRCPPTFSEDVCP